MEPPSPSLSQATFAAAILATAGGSYVALTPPSPSRETTATTGPANPSRSEGPGQGPASKENKDNKEKKKRRRANTATKEPPAPPSSKHTPSDTISTLALTSPAVITACLAPVGLFSLHAAALACYFPFRIPGRLLGYAAISPIGINPDLISWSAATAVPMAVILCAGVPLRLGPYAALGRNFTFALTRPDRLTTTGIYKYVQHPGYVGVVLTVVGNAALLFRPEGVLCCWVPPRWMEMVVRWKVVQTVMAAGGVVGAWLLWKRTVEEEKMLRREFGKEWKEWNAKTARFIPGVF
ncbi:isoprenylcysteine carboxyl methyltransferase [Podospora conica]|nr:isoprenylcysteine carboxyl methyltransferase [Schizothecium conicum]